ncbi:MAG: hypothetical protein AMXMBFR82_13790 [Candidatus Hydrogenedentota bacterium]
MDTRVEEQATPRRWHNLLKEGRVRAYGPAVLTLLVGVVASVLFFNALRVRDQQAAQYIFGEQAKTYIRSIEKLLDSNVHAVQWSAITLAVSSVSPEEVFQRNLDAMGEEQAHTLTLCWVPSAAPADSASYPIAAAIARGEPGNQEDIVGFDLAADPVAARYLQFARESGKTYVIANSAQIQDLFGPSTALVVSAVHTTEAGLSGDDAARGRFTGFVAGVFQIEKVVDVALRRLNQERVNLDVFDAFATSGESALYHRSAEAEGVTRVPVEEGEILFLDRMHYTGPVDLASTRRWLFVCTPTRAHLAEAFTWQPLLGLLAGLSLTAVVFDHFMAQIRQRRKAEALVKHRTAELQRTNEHLSEEIAARIQFEEERDSLLELLERSNDSLQELNRKLAISNADLQDFAVIASHDLKEPLRKVRVLAESLRKIVGDGHENRAEEYVDLIDSCTERMQRLITNILQVSRVTTHGNPFSTVDLTQIALDAVEDLTVRIHETGGTVDVQPLPTIDADPMQMKQLLQNLIDNGLKYGDDHSTPRVQVFPSEIPDHEGRAGFCAICVQDNGPGINPEDADRIFALFQRMNGSESREGSGVGLAVCRKIAERHGGSIRIVPAPDRGTRFVVALPVAHDIGDASEEASEITRTDRESAHTTYESINAHDQCITYR